MLVVEFKTRQRDHASRVAGHPKAWFREDHSRTYVVYLFAQLVDLSGAIATPQLAAAVSEAGRLGMLGASRAGITPAALSALIDAVRTRTGSPFGVNFPASSEQLALLDLKCVELAARGLLR